MEKSKDSIMEILNDGMRENGHTLMRKIGTWKETRVGTGYDSGFYLEAVELPADAPRYLQASTALMDEESETKPLADGSKVWMKIDENELTYRIEGK